MADVHESNVYVVTQGRKLYGMPTDFGFCIKVMTLARPWGGGGGQELPRHQDPTWGLSAPSWVPTHFSL